MTAVNIVFCDKIIRSQRQGLFIRLNGFLKFTGVVPVVAFQSEQAKGLRQWIFFKRLNNAICCLVLF